ncbi:phenylalanine 4-monooxygenase, partial [Ilumatobacter sp.]|uniref:phenylalanine 4-monooxygenase n=1 Tax=Ilumatobacter sp. TaxID=1967498 RepID=UPI003C67B7B7
TSPAAVTTTGEGEPPESYWERRRAIAARAAGPDRPLAHIDYTDAEHAVWATVSATLGPLWERFAATEVLAARDRLGLPTDRLPQLAEVDAALRPLTGFGYCAVAGLVPSDEFFGALARGIFSSTQYVRWQGSPLYTPEPDVIHEVIGHANCLACPEIAELHRLAGEAVGRVQGDRQRQFIYDVFWFSAEFGVVRQDTEHGPGVRAYGAGLLSSPGELEWFGGHAEIRPLDLVRMGRIGYDIDEYQPVLFAGESLAQVLDLVGGFFAEASDESVDQLLTAPM